MGIFDCIPSLKTCCLCAKDLKHASLNIAVATLVLLFVRLHREFPEACENEPTANAKLMRTCYLICSYLNYALGMFIIFGAFSLLTGIWIRRSVLIDIYTGSILLNVAIWIITLIISQILWSISKHYGYKGDSNGCPITDESEAEKKINYLYLITPSLFVGGNVTLMTKSQGLEYVINFMLLYFAVVVNSYNKSQRGNNPSNVGNNSNSDLSNSSERGIKSAV